MAMVNGGPWVWYRLVRFGLVLVLVSVQSVLHAPGTRAKNSPERNWGIFRKMKTSL